MEHQNIVLLIASGVITTLLGVAGYFLKGVMSNMRDLNKSIIDLRVAFEGEKQRLISLSDNQLRLQKGVEGKLISHSKKIDNHETRISVLEHTNKINP